MRRRSGERPSHDAFTAPAQFTPMRSRALTFAAAFLPRGVMLSAHQEVEALLDQIRARAGDAATLRLTDQLSVLCRSYMTPASDARWERLGLTRLEARLMAALVDRIGQCVGKGALMGALYFDRAAEPDPKIVDIMVCKIRKKIAGSGFVIETVWGQGYRAKFDAPPQENVMAAAAVAA
jgi:Transcriptional regulatory protein, C terminal